jgi:hypothetical protein
MFEKLRNASVMTAAPFERIGAFLEPYAAKANALVAPYWESFSGWYEKREPREKTLLRALGVVAGLLFVYEAIYSPLIATRQDLADKVVARRQELVEIRGMMRTYERLRKELAASETRTVSGGNDFSLFSVIEQTLTREVGRDKIGSIAPGNRQSPGGLTQYTVDVKLNNLALAQVVDALYGVQSLAVPISVSNFHIREHAQNSHSYDVDMTCMAVGKHA